MTIYTDITVKLVNRFATAKPRALTMNRHALTLTYRIAAGLAIAFAGGGIVFPMLAAVAVVLAVVALIAYRVLNPMVPIFTRYVGARAAYRPPEPVLNPATGLPMVSGVDTGGNLYGAGRRPQ